jgi:cytoskeletal protein RodZ
MQSLGRWLQQAREAKGITLQDAEDVTRIRTRYLKALEMGDYDAMPAGDPQARGFLRRYAAFLDLSPDDAISRYEEEVHGRTPKVAVEPSPKASITVSPARPMDLSPSYRNIWPVIGVIVLVVFLGVGGWWLLSTDFGSTPVPEPSSSPTQPPTATQSVSQSTPTEPTQATLSPEAETTSAAAPAPSSEGVTLVLEPQEHVWIRVTADGAVVFQGLLARGSPQTWTAAESIVVEAGNGGGAIATVNGQEQGPLGRQGEVAVRGWGPQGELEPPLP